jgi:hypothetical protein
MTTLARPAPCRRSGVFVRWMLASIGFVLSGACSSSEQGGMADGGRQDAATGSGGRAGSGGAQGSSGGVSGSGSGGSTGSGGSIGTGGGSGAGGGTPGTGGTSGSGELGFTYRKPGPTDVDWLCTFRQGGVSGHAYVRLDQTGTMMSGIATVPVYAATLAQLSIAGAVSNLANAQYDYGGGHHNDSLRFDHQGKTYKYYHSSFGFGFRQCQPMDCISVYALGATTPENDGCTSARRLPEICVAIKADGSHDPLVDRFMKCAGDSTSALEREQ